MNIWLDAHLSPQLANWLTETFGVEAVAVRDLGLREATDVAIFAVARSAGATVLTKDRDFADLVRHHGPPPRILWLTCGNTSNARLREVLSATFPAARHLLERGDPLVELRDAAPQ